ncbi:hypothetical protein [Nocardia sp. NPDC059691]|uniref:hypothetical protein n=1 Tax=Nocardia sp. NPDC059691 TaxID=3346908 RepID=UPI00369BD9C9
MIAVQDLMSWLRGLDPRSGVGIREDDLTLVATGRDSNSTRGCIRVGGSDSSAESTPLTESAMSHYQIGVAASHAVITVSDLQEMVGSRLTRTELEHVRAAIKRSTISDFLKDVVFAVTETRRHQLTDSVRTFPDAAAYAGSLGPQPLSAMPAAQVGSILAEIESATGLALIRVRCGDEARLCVDDRATGRLFEVDEVLQSWLHGYDTSPGLPVDWIGSAIGDFTRDELVESGPRDYVLPKISALLS